MKAELDRAAQGLEAFFLRQVMKEALPQLGGDAQFGAMLQEALADELAKSGGLGIGQSLAAELGGGAAAPAPVATAVPVAHALRSYGISSGFGARTDPIHGGHGEHHGVDLPAPIGQAVQVPYDGVITRADPDAGGYGQLVVVDHGGGVETRYAHLSAIDVRPGQRVHRGETIGAVGSSGRSTGPHLHFELRRDGHPVDPTRHLDPRTALGPPRSPR